MKGDIEKLVNIFNNNYENIGLWGISIGGIPTSEMIKMSSFYSKIKFAIMDRNFSSIESVIKSTLSELLIFPYKILMFENSDNVENYINDLNIKKLIICDANDDIIPDKSSLKVGIANKMISNKFRKSLVSKNSISFLKIFMRDDDYMNFINAIGIIINNKKILTGLDLNDLYSENEVDFYFLNKKISYNEESSTYLLEKSESEYDKIHEFKNDKETNQDIKYQKYLGRCGYNLLHENVNYQELKEYIEDFDSCWNLLTNFQIMKSKKSKVEFIESFFECLYIFGSYNEILTTKEYIEKIETDNSCKSFRNNGIQKMDEMTRKLKVIIEQFEEQENVNFYKDKIDVLKSFKNGLIQISEYYKNNKISSLEDMAIGYLLPISSGHNGELEKESIEVLSSFFKSLDLK